MPPSEFRPAKYENRTDEGPYAERSQRAFGAIWRVAPNAGSKIILSQAGRSRKRRRILLSIRGSPGRTGWTAPVATKPARS